MAWLSLKVGRTTTSSYVDVAMDKPLWDVKQRTFALQYLIEWLQVHDGLGQPCICPMLDLVGVYDGAVCSAALRPGGDVAVVGPRVVPGQADEDAAYVRGGGRVSGDAL